MNYLKHFWRYIQNKYYDLVYPDLKNSRQYTPVDNNKEPCNLCKKVRPKSMIKCETNSTGEAGEVICIKCYHKNIGSEFKKLLLKWKRRLITIGITLLFIVETGVIIYLLIPHKYKPNTLYRDTLVEYFYPRIDKTISRDDLQTQIDVILDIFLFTDLGVALNARESNFDPRLVNKESGAIGNFQIMSEWVEKLKKQGIIKNDVRDLFNPKINCYTGNFVFRQHFKDAHNNLPFALKGYVGSKKPPHEEQYIKDVLYTLGVLSFIRLAVEQDGFKKEDINKMLDFYKKSTVLKKKGRP